MRQVLQIQRLHIYKSTDKYLNMKCYSKPTLIMTHRDLPYHRDIHDLIPTFISTSKHPLVNNPD